MPTTLTAVAIESLPEVRPGDDLSELIADALARQEETIEPGDVLVMAHKIVSKAEGRTRRLRDVEPGPRAIELGQVLKKDPRHVQVVLDESKAVRRASGGVLICVTHHGFVCANAGVDASNVPGEDTLVLLPKDPDATARNLRSALKRRLGTGPAVVITDSFGRAWRHGQVDIAIGCAGLEPIEDWRGRTDAAGRELKATRIAVADELAAAADLTRTKDGGLPLVLIRGAGRHVGAGDGPGAAALIRPEAEDLFR
ncbi:MAG TPA: coenzyme F420-0:L-glutamate ligase [Solirubrobacteraceae bacterium]|nr:coenzyme F420-0:L-glutamate ligase [Solirubrobacteraceae bacterium]